MKTTEKEPEVKTITVKDYDSDQGTVILHSSWPNTNVGQIPQLDKMAAATLDTFDAMVRRAYNKEGWSHFINSSYREGDPKSHGRGEAIDFYFYRFKPGDIDLDRQLLFALQYEWRGIGFYPYWNTPGLHVDTRTDLKWKERRAIWQRTELGAYVTGWAAGSQLDA